MSMSNFLQTYSTLSKGDVHDTSCQAAASTRSWSNVLHTCNVNKIALLRSRSQSLLTCSRLQHLRVRSEPEQNAKSFRPPIIIPLPARYPPQCLFLPYLLPLPRTPPSQLSVSTKPPIPTNPVVSPDRCQG